MKPDPTNEPKARWELFGNDGEVVAEVQTFAWMLDQYAYPKANELSGRFLRTKSGIVIANSEEQARDIVWKEYGNDCCCNLRLDPIEDFELKPGFICATAD